MITIRAFFQRCLIVAALLGGLLGSPSNAAAQNSPKKMPPIAPARLLVQVTAQPNVITPGQPTRLEATVTFDGKPVSEAEVVFEAGGGLFGSSGTATSKPVMTGRDGVCTDRWTYDQKMFARAYGLSAKATFRGETARGEVIVRVVDKLPVKLAIQVKASPMMLTPGQKTRVAATVTYDGKPAPAAEVVFSAGDGLFDSSGKNTGKPTTTGRDGVASDEWTYQKKTFAPRGYALNAKVTFQGETAESDVIVRIVDKSESRLAVEVTSRPTLVTPGRKAQLLAKVTYDGKPVIGAEVVFEAGDGQFNSSGKNTSKPVVTAQGGVCSDEWIYMKKTFAPGGYALTAKVSYKGETAQGEVTVRVIKDIE